MNGVEYPYGSNSLLSKNTKLYPLANEVSKLVYPVLEDHQKPVTLIQLSGGIDSAFVLWYWLINNPDQYCVVNHIELIHYENRNKKELAAVDRILNWLDSKGLNNYYYFQNTFDYGNIPDLVYDVEVCGFIAGIILSSPLLKSIESVYLPIYGHQTNREETRREVMKLTAGREVECVYPLVGLEKLDVMKMIPYELLKLCWYCRVPINDEACGNCYTCKQVLEAHPDVVEENLKNFLKNF